jgi:hypothetical protein
MGGIQVFQGNSLISKINSYNIQHKKILRQVYLIFFIYFFKKMNQYHEDRIDNQIQEVKD